MVNLAEIDPVLQEVGEGAVGEGDRTVEFGDFGAAPFGDDASAVEFAHQLAEGL